MLAEDGGEPRLRIWLYDKGKALAASAIKVSATVSRLTGEKQALNFAPTKTVCWSRDRGNPMPSNQHRGTNGQCAFRFNQREEGKSNSAMPKSRRHPSASTPQGCKHQVCPGAGRDPPERTAPRMSSRAWRAWSKRAGQLWDKRSRRGQVLAVITSPTAFSSSAANCRRRKAAGFGQDHLRARAAVGTEDFEQDYLQAGQAMNEGAGRQ